MRMFMADILHQISVCIEKGKIDISSPHPTEWAGFEGADELTRTALSNGISPHDILKSGFIAGMERVGEAFRRSEIYLPDVLLAARAMTAGMAHLKPYFQSGAVLHRGTILLATVTGDLHDIGKKIAGMFFEGAGWNVVDCGVDVSVDGLLEAVGSHRPQVIGLSALLTTTMVSMESMVRSVKIQYPEMWVIIGGAPITPQFAARIGADHYSPDPQGAVDFLKEKGF